MTTRLLVLGYGNPGRRDDGLGPALIVELEKEPLPGVTLDSDYQLTVEDASAAAAHEIVVFADAAEIGPEPFAFERLQARRGVSFSSHSLSPGAVLSLASELFGKSPAAYLLKIRGYEFDRFENGLSSRAAENLARSLEFARRFIAQAASESFSENPVK